MKGDSFFCFAQDVLDRGAEALCAEVSERGTDGLTLAVAYHASTDFRPRTKPGGIAELPSGAVYFAPSEEFYADCDLRPLCPEPYRQQDIVAQAREATRERVMSLTAWTVFCFNERLGRQQPEVAQRGVFGEARLTDLCPANPAVRRYAVALAREVMRYKPDSLLAESLHYGAFREPRRFFPLGPRARLALTLCFCDHCRTAGRAVGVNVDAVVRWATDAAGAALAGHDHGDEEEAVLDHRALRELAGGEVLGLLRARAEVVRSLAAEVSDVVRNAGGRFCFMDQAAAGTSVVGPTIVDDALTLGVSVEKLVGCCDGYQVLGYASAPGQVAESLATYRKALGTSVPIRLALRPSWPDSVSLDNLRAKVAAGRRADVVGIDFYHYGLMPDAALDRVSAALAEEVAA